MYPAHLESCIDQACRDLCGTPVLLMPPPSPPSLLLPPLQITQRCAANVELLGSGARCKPPLQSCACPQDYQCSDTSAGTMCTQVPACSARHPVSLASETELSLSLPLPPHALHHRPLVWLQPWVQPAAAPTHAKHANRAVHDMAACRFSPAFHLPHHSSLVPSLRRLW